MQYIYIYHHVLNFDLVDSIHLGGTVSQIFDLGPTSYFMSKTFYEFLQLNFLDSIK